MVPTASKDTGNRTEDNRVYFWIAIVFLFVALIGRILSGGRLGDTNTREARRFAVLDRKTTVLDKNADWYVRDKWDE